MDRPLEHRREPLQCLANILVGILGLLHIERLTEGELMAMLESPVEGPHDWGAGIARHANRSRRQGCLLPEERHRQAILKEIAVCKDADQFASLQSGQHPPEPAGSHLFQTGTTAFTEIGHAGVNELRHGAGHQ